VGKDEVNGESGLRDKKMTKKKMTELRFRSCSEHVFDAKGRLDVPSRFREVLFLLGII
jgi:hypothetical protein